MNSTDMLDINEEMDDDFFEIIAGGIYTEEEWKNMTMEERKEAWLVSKMNRIKHEYCQLD